ncbi:phage tail terminator-like protein [Aureimonas phyllosphaerae]|uniref:phage tail terminator-like protein n=1 Tax=Aureimonas phyllosphaerae TaxID=1166078 RepID=UPI003A5BDB9B
MADLSVVQAVERRIRASFTRCPILVENSNEETPEDAGPWLLIDFPWSQSEWVTADEFEERGGFRVMLSVVAGVGTHEGRAWLEEIATLFRGQSFEGVQCMAPQSPVTSDRNDAAGYFRLEITVPYQTIIIG